MLMESVKNCTDLTKSFLMFLLKITEYAYFWNKTSATIQKTCWRRTLYMLVYDTNSVELILFSVLAHTFRVLSRKGWNLLPVFKCNITVNSVRIDNFYTDFRLQIRCSFWIFLNIIQKDDIENRGIRGVKCIDTIKLRKSFQVLIGNTD